MKKFVENWLDKVTKGVVAIGGAIAGLYVGLDVMVKVLMWIMIFDYLTGILVASKNKSLKSKNGGLNSKVGFNGILKKILMGIIVAVAALIDLILGDKAMFRDMVVFFYIANETLSIVENAALVDAKIIPPKFKKILEQWKEKESKIEAFELMQNHPWMCICGYEGNRNVDLGVCPKCHGKGKCEWNG